VSSRHHYVPQWYLKGFCDPTTPAGREPSLWVRKFGETLADYTDARRSPKNLAAQAGYYEYETPDPDRFERFLSRMEDRAAFTTRAWLARPAGTRGEVPGELLEFLAWLAARVPMMQRVLEEWWVKLILSTDWGADGGPSAEDYFISIVDHQTGATQVCSVTLARPHLESGSWTSIPSQSQRVDFIRQQATYFATEHFPKFKHLILTAPEGRSFLVSDRPLAWFIPGEASTSDLPSALKHPNVEVSVPLDRSNALLLVHRDATFPARVEPWEINVRTAGFAERFVAGADLGEIDDTFARLVDLVVGGIDAIVSTRRS
jgi:Protein of unknown function (DUF4238)